MNGLDNLPGIRESNLITKKKNKVDNQQANAVLVAVSSQARIRKHNRCRSFTTVKVSMQQPNGEPVGNETVHHFSSAH